MPGYNHTTRARAYAGKLAQYVPRELLLSNGEWLLDIESSRVNMKKFKRRCNVRYVSAGLTSQHEQAIKQKKEIIIKEAKDKKTYEVYSLANNNQIKCFNLNLGNDFGNHVHHLEEKTFGCSEHDPFVRDIYHVVSEGGGHTGDLEEEPGYLEEDLLYQSIRSHYTAKLLFKHNPIFYFDAGFILHLSLECLLKAWMLYVKDEFTSTHNLKKLIEDASLNFRDDIMGLILDIDKLYKLRYGSTDVGNEEFIKFEEILDYIFNIMPVDLKKKYLDEKKFFNNIVQEISKSFALHGSR
jgi:HEPN domain-containing protein